jgi:glycosyltransferase involved in cell wall biosynthesis
MPEPSLSLDLFRRSLVQLIGWRPSGSTGRLVAGRSGTGIPCFARQDHQGRTWCKITPSSAIWIRMRPNQFKRRIDLPKVSVLMPLYNTAPNHLKDAVESILNQSYKDFEFLILNDSPENIKLDEIIRSYKDDRIIYLKNEKNLGITSSRNKLIDLAKGQYLAVMDHDDISLPERFEKQVAYLDQNLEVGVIGCSVLIIPKRKIYEQPMEDKVIKLMLMAGCAVTHPASMIRKRILIENDIRYEQQFSPAEDYALWCRLISHTNFHNLPEILFQYREHKTNTSKTQKTKMGIAESLVWNFARRDNPALYDEFKFKAIHTTRFRLLGFIPLFKIVKHGEKTKILLFNKIPFLYFQTRSRYQKES